MRGHRCRRGHRRGGEGPDARPARHHLSRLLVRPVRILSPRRTDGVHALRLPRRPQGRRLRRAGEGAGRQSPAVAGGDLLRGGRGGAAGHAHVVACTGREGRRPPRPDRAGAGCRQRGGERRDPDRAALRGPRHDHGRQRRRERVRAAARRRARGQLPHARLRRRGEAVDRQARRGRRRRAHRRRHVRTLDVRADSDGHARHHRLPRHALGAPRPAPRLLEEPPYRRDEPRAPAGPRPRRGRTSRARHRPGVCAEGHACRRAARARSQEQGQSPPRPVTLAGLLERATLRQPRAEALVDGAARLTYDELDARTAALGGGLADLGVGRGDRVLLVLKNRVEHVLAYWALQRIAAVATPVNFRLAAGEIDYLLADSGARLVIFEAATAAPVLEAVRGRGNVTLVYVGAAEPPGAVRFDEIAAGGGARGRRPALAPGPEEADLSLILYTSGTTGRPKGVPRTHRNHVAGAVAHALQCGYTWEERTLGVMPLYHTMGIHALTSMVAVNGCFVCQRDWSPGEALRLVAAEQIGRAHV